MHWLGHRIHEMLDRYGDDDSRVVVARRREFLDEIGALVDEISRRDGVTAAFASYEGLLVAASGLATDFEALAAMAQAAMVPAFDSAGVIELGTLRQLVLVGDHNKLALVRVGPVTLGMVAPTDVSLAAATA